MTLPIGTRIRVRKHWLVEGFSVIGLVVGAVWLATLGLSY